MISDDNNAFAGINWNHIVEHQGWLRLGHKQRKITETNIFSFDKWHDKKLCQLATHAALPWYPPCLDLLPVELIEAE